MNLKEIQELIRFVSKAGVTEVELAQGDFKITIKTQSEEERALITKLSSMQGFQGQVQYAPQPMMMQAPSQAPQNAVNTAESNTATVPSQTPANPDAGTVAINSPMIGTFYRKPAPDKPLFVNVGDKVSKGQVVCVIEAMKLFNEIESEVSGTIVKVMADDTSPVEYGQPLFLVQPE